MKELVTKAAENLRETLRDLGSETDAILFDIVIASFDDEIKELQAKVDRLEAPLECHADRVYGPAILRVPPGYREFIGTQNNLPPVPIPFDTEKFLREGPGGVPDGKFLAKGCDDSLDDDRLNRAVMGGPENLRFESLSVPKDAHPTPVEQPVDKVADDDESRRERYRERKKEGSSQEPAQGSETQEPIDMAQIRQIIGKPSSLTFDGKRMSGKTFRTIVERRFREGIKFNATMICETAGISTSLLGGLNSATRRHIEALHVHPRPEWQEAYLDELEKAVEAR